MLDKIKEMELYMVQSTQEIALMYEDKINAEIMNKGHVNVAAYLQHLEMRDDENRQPWE